MESQETIAWMFARTTSETKIARTTCLNTNLCLVPLVSNFIYLKKDFNTVEYAILNAEM